MNHTVDLVPENKQLHETLTKKEQHFRKLEEMLRSFNHRQFGASSEKNSINKACLMKLKPMPDLSRDDTPATDAITVPAHQRKKKRISISDWVKREEIIHDLPAAEKVFLHDDAFFQALRIRRFVVGLLSKIFKYD